MMRAMRLAASGIVLILSLASCDILFNGAFPSSLGQATARIDLSDRIGLADASTFNLSIARSYGYEFVILHSTATFDSTKDHLVVLSPGLTIRNEYPLSAVSYPTYTYNFSGSSVFAHLSDGHIVVGNFDGLATSAGLVPAGQLSFSLDNWAIIGSTTMSIYAWSGFGTNSTTNTLSYSGYKMDWTPGSIPTHTRTIRSLDAAHPQLWLNGVFTNPEDDLGSTALFVFGEQGSNTSYFVQIPKSDLDTSPTPAIFDSGYPTFSKSSLDYGSVAVTTGGIVAFDGSTRSWIRFTQSDPNTVTSLYVGERNRNEKISFSYSGGYYCVWDPVTRSLTRYEDWW
jgi:hypothetical protein